MDKAAIQLPELARLIFPALLGFVLSSALQLQQAVLLPWQFYAGLMLLAALPGLLAATKSIAIVWRMALVALAFGILAFALTGLRASVFFNNAMDPSLEGRDLAVSGVIVAMPQRNEAGLRFRFEIESARLGGQAVRLPPGIYLGWYSSVWGERDVDPEDALQPQPLAIEAGERWRMTVRLKAPHGASNPFGYDYELWLWEQGLQASGYVRAGPKDPSPQRLAQTFLHPLELARPKERDRIFEHVTEPKAAR